MRSASGLYRLHTGLALVGVAAVALGLAVVLTRISFDGLSLDALASACRRVGFDDVGFGSLLLLFLASLSVAVVGLALRSAVSQIRVRRRFLGDLRVAGRVDAGGREALVIEGEQPRAFCAGLWQPRIYVSRPTLDLLRADELEAVIAHEGHHARRRDPLRLFVARALADSLFFLPALRRLTDRYAALAELAADEAAVRRSGTRRPLAAALLVFDESPGGAVVGIAPERVDHLLGMHARWELPAVLLVGAAVTLVGLAALVVRTAEATARASVELPLLLAQGCMVGMAVLPVLVGAAALLASKRVLAG